METQLNYRQNEMGLIRSSFDYTTLECSEEIKNFAQSVEVKIKGRELRRVYDIIETGRDLIKLKKQLEYGQFTNWLETCFPGSAATAYRWMQIGESLKGNDISELSELSPSILYQIAAPSTPEAARKEIVERVEEGETLTIKEAKEIVDKFKERGKVIQQLESKIRALNQQKSAPPTEDGEPGPSKKGRVGCSPGNSPGCPKLFAIGRSQVKSETRVAFGFRIAETIPPVHFWDLRAFDIPRSIRASAHNPRKHCIARNHRNFREAALRPDCSGPDRRPLSGL